MRILFLTQVLPYPLDAGPKVRAYYVLRHLAQQHDVTLVSFVRPTDTPEAVSHLGEYCTSIHTTPMPRSRMLNVYHLARSLANGMPFVILRDQMHSMEALLDDVLDQSPAFDAVHADQLWMAYYAMYVREQAMAGRPMLTVLDQHNAVYRIPERMAGDTGNPIRRLLLALESRKLARYELNACQAFDRVVWVTNQDYLAVRNQTNRNESAFPVACTIPICVDTSASAAIKREPRARRITFLGGMHYPPNAEGVIWFAEKVLPTVLDIVPDAIFTVIGRRPPSALYRSHIPPGNLDMTGFVDDPAHYLAETAAFVVPLAAGGGMRVKILDAWQWGLPVISTTVGAEGIEISPDQDILVADTPDDFAAATIRLLQDPDTRSRLSVNAQVTLQKHYDWCKVYRLWDQVYSSPAGDHIRVPLSTDVGVMPVLH